MNGEVIITSRLIRQACIGSVLTAAVCEDMRTYRIRNELIIAGSVMGVMLAVQCARPPDQGMAAALLQWGWRVIATAAVLFLFYLAGALGAGDVKLCAVIAGMMRRGETGRFLGLSLILGAAAGAGSIAGEIRRGNGGQYVQAFRTAAQMITCRLLTGARETAGGMHHPGSVHIPVGVHIRRVHFTALLAAGYALTLLGQCI